MPSQRRRRTKANGRCLDAAAGHGRKGARESGVGGTRGRQAGEIEENHLVITIEVTNSNATDKLEFDGWSQKAAQVGVTLTDDRGKECEVKPMAVAGRLDKPLPTMIKPGESANDILAFEIPDPKVKSLWLKLSASLQSEWNGVLQYPREDDYRQTAGCKSAKPEAETKNHLSPRQARLKRISASRRRTKAPVDGLRRANKLPMGVVLYRQEGSMLRSVEGVYREGRIELVEPVPEA